MLLIDRYIIVRFLAGFAILFALLFIFAGAVDVILNLDRFSHAAREAMGGDAGTLAVFWKTIGAIVDFQAPRLFQFYAYLYGLVAVGAMAFTLTQMYRHRELVATMAAGLSLHRMAVPFVAVVFGLCVVQLLNQELILPRIAPLLLRRHGDIGQRTVDVFAVPLTPDGAGHLLHSPRFDPQTGTLEFVTIIERDEDGRTTRRVTADRAAWTPTDEIGATGWWTLTGGRSTAPLQAMGDASDPEETLVVETYRTDLGPDAITARRYGEYATMLSMPQISAMLATPGYGDAKTVRSLLRLRYGRFASVLVSLLVFVLAMPSFLLRAPTNLLVRTIECAVISIPATIGAAMMMMMDLGGIPPAVSVFVPVTILGPLALARWTYLAT